MKKRFVCTISLLLMACLLLALSACNDGSLLPDKNSTSASPSETQLAQEKLIAIRDRIHQNLRYSKGYDKQDYENLCAAYSAGNPFPDTVTEEQWDYFDLTDYYRVLHEEPDNSRFHSPEMVSQLSSGMLINEVYDILGAPHFVAEAYLMDTSYGESSCYSYSFTYCVMERFC